VTFRETHKQYFRRTAIVTVPSADIVMEFAPTGQLRAAINSANPVLVQIDPATGAPGGVTMELARELAHRLGVPLAPMVIDGAGKSFDAVKAASCDIGFLAIEPARAAEIDFTAAYVIIEGVYAVRADSGIAANEEVDRSGVRIAVNKGAAYDLFLTRSLKAATLIRAEEATDVFARDKLEVLAGVKQGVVRFAQGNPGVRVLPGRFMEIQQAMCLPKGRAAAAKYLAAFVEEMKASGMIADALKRSSQPDAAVAPAAVP
jgi:polar amino acid transport system substrate-binding protein